MKFGSHTVVPMDDRLVLWADSWPNTTDERKFCDDYARELASSVGWCQVIILAHQPDTGLPFAIAKAFSR